MTLNLSCIVEGHGDVAAAPVLLRRIQQQCDPAAYLEIARPIRIARHKLVRTGELEKAVAFAANQIALPRAVLVLIDADDDCPAELGPALLARAKRVRGDVPIAVVLAKYEFEAWFLAAIESLAGERGLAESLPPIAAPEGIRDAKGTLTHHMTGARSYRSRIDQPALAARFDMTMARKRSASFDKCCRDVERLLAQTSTTDTIGESHEK